jgi:hypothetical protein
MRERGCCIYVWGKSERERDRRLDGGSKDVGVTLMKKTVEKGRSEQGMREEALP